MTRARRLRAPLATLGALVVVLFGSIPAAAAHPLGNFTVNRYVEVTVSATVVRVGYVLDLAEIPSFQARQELAEDSEGWADERISEIVDNLVLEVDGGRLPLAAVDRRLSQPEGLGGLPTTRLVVQLEAEMPAGDPGDVRSGRIADASDPNRIGWREIVVTVAGDAEIVMSDVPAEGLSDALRQYPEDRLRSPLDVRKASFQFIPGRADVAASTIDGAIGDRTVGDRFTDLLDRRRLTPVVLVGMLAVAALVGGGHALAPGHGKTVMAAYLIGTRGRPIDAVLLGVIVSAMHTTSVLMLGLVLYQVDQSLALDRIYPVLTLVSGAGVLLVGAWLATTRWRALRGGPDRSHMRIDHDHGPNEPDLHEHPDGIDHDHGVDHGNHRLVAGGTDREVVTASEATLVQDDEGPVPIHDHHAHLHHRGPGGHSHDLPEGVAPLSTRGLLLLATAGGVVPSPSAVIVLVSAFTLQRVGLGLALVAAFSFGLAATLTAVGLALVVGSRALGDRVSLSFVRVFPVIGAAALVVLGLILVAQGVTGL